MNAPTPAPQTLFDKIWIEHHVLEREDGQSMLYVDSHFLDRRPLSKCCASAA
jgi:3-isopropylmalate/(R)-2-methylmalate dehydratase large subunit